MVIVGTSVGFVLCKNEKVSFSDWLKLATKEELDEAYDNKEDTSKIKLPDPRKPEEMKEPVAVMIDMSSCEKFASIYGDSDEAIAFGLITSAPNEDMLIKFIDYLMK